MADKIKVEHLGRQHLQVRQDDLGVSTAAVCLGELSLCLAQISASTVLPISAKLAFQLITHAENEKVGVRVAAWLRPSAAPPARRAAVPPQLLLSPPIAGRTHRSSATWSAAHTTRCWSGTTWRGGWWWRASTRPPGASSRSAGACAPGCALSRTAAPWCPGSSWCTAGGCRQHRAPAAHLCGVGPGLAWRNLPCCLLSAMGLVPLLLQVQPPADLWRPVGGAGAAASRGRRAVLPAVVGAGGREGCLGARLTTVLSLSAGFDWIKGRRMGCPMQRVCASSPDAQAPAGPPNLPVCAGDAAGGVPAAPAGRHPAPAGLSAAARHLPRPEGRSCAHQCGSPHAVAR